MACSFCFIYSHVPQGLRFVDCNGDPPRLKVRLAAPPVDGEANCELVAFLSKKLKIPKSAIMIVRGEHGRLKDVFCQGVDAAAAGSKLLTVA